jgi:hypothetical protein
MGELKMAWMASYSVWMVRLPFSSWILRVGRRWSRRGGSEGLEYWLIGRSLIMLMN